VLYSRLFYAAQRIGSARSAKALLPVVFDHANPSSVVDVGCGAGTWLAAARRLGAEKAVGIEGAWVANVRLASPDIHMHHADLEAPLPRLGRFDLAMCLEVAEHLTRDRAEGLVVDLCALSDTVLFSAAIPWQGGIGHLNEQPQSYWAGLFGDNGFGAHDIVRPRVWNDGRVSYWYRQNAILYCKGIPGAVGTTLDRRHPSRFFNPWCVVEIVDRMRGLTAPRRRRMRSPLSDAPG
jgi:SAM-dependent methyltransferase